MTIRWKLALVTSAIVGSCLMAAPLPQQTFPEPVLDSLNTAFGAYEVVREDLATDQLEQLPATAARLGDAFRKAIDADAELAEGVPAALKAAAERADSLAKVEDIAAARAEFGELSRQMLLLANVDSRLAEGRHVFACPMVKTFPKWIQPDAKLDNPYMGKSMPACGFTTDWSDPETEARVVLEPQTGTSDEPEFIPGIPGVKMVDVRDHKFLWREIDELQRWERTDRISIAEFRGKVIEKTAHFLGFTGAKAASFAETADEAVMGVRTAFRKMVSAGRNPGDADTGFTSDLNAKVAELTATFQGEPRHLLFEPGCKKWLLKLAFGPSEDKEKAEAGASSGI